MRANSCDLWSAFGTDKGLLGGDAGRILRIATTRLGHCGRNPALDKLAYREPASGHTSDLGSPNPSDDAPAPAQTTVARKDRGLKSTC